MKLRSACGEPLVMSAPPPPRDSGSSWKAESRIEYSCVFQALRMTSQQPSPSARPPGDPQRKLSRLVSQRGGPAGTWAQDGHTA